MLETRKLDNNKTRKALFVNLRPLDMYALAYFKNNYSGVLEMCRSSVVNISSPDELLFSLIFRDKLEPQ